MKLKLKAMLGGLILTTIFFAACSNNLDLTTNYLDQENTADEFSLPITQIESYFNQVREILYGDDGELWGQNLYGPMLIIDPETLDTVANQPDNEGILTRAGNVYVGRFSEDAFVANSVTTFGGKDWSMVMWPLPYDENSRNVLMVHEMFHNKQGALNLLPNDITDLVYDNSHMDTLEARLSIQLELNALLAALKSDGEERLAAIQDVLSIRYGRREQFSSGDSENILEIHEGLPEYTALRLIYSSTEELKAHIASEFDTRFSAQPSFVRNFAYFTVPIYGLLLDAGDLNWRQHVRYDTDLGELLRNACNLQEFNPQSVLTEEILNKYGYVEIRERELAIQQERDEIVAYYRDKFTDRPTLIIPVIDMDGFRFTFDPHAVRHVPDLGAVYPTAEMMDTWGHLVVHEGGSLIIVELMQIIVTADDLSIEENVVAGAGWTLFLNDGYTVTSDDEGNFVVNK